PDAHATDVLVERTVLTINERATVIHSRASARKRDPATSLGAMRPRRVHQRSIAWVRSKRRKKISLALWHHRALCSVESRRCTTNLASPSASPTGSEEPQSADFRIVATSPAGSPM